MTIGMVLVSEIITLVSGDLNVLSNTTPLSVFLNTVFSVQCFLYSVQCIVLSAVFLAFQERGPLVTRTIGSEQGLRLRMNILQQEYSALTTSFGAGFKVSSCNGAM